MREYRATTKCVSTDNVKENVRSHPIPESSVPGLNAVWFVSTMTRQDTCHTSCFSGACFRHIPCGARAQLHCGLLTGCGEHSRTNMCMKMVWCDVSSRSRCPRSFQGLHVLPLGSSESCLLIHFQLTSAQLENTVLTRGPTFGPRPRKSFRKLS